MSYGAQVSPDGRWEWDGARWVPRSAVSPGGSGGGRALLVLALLIGIGIVAAKGVEYVIYADTVRSGDFFADGVPYFYREAYLWGLTGAGALGVLLAAIGAATSRGVGRGLAIWSLLAAGVGCGMTVLNALYSFI